MTHGRKKSDPAIVAGKPTNKAGSTAAELVEPRARAKGNASQQSTHRTQGRTSVSQALERVRKIARQRKKESILHPWPNQRFAVKYPRWEPDALIAPVRIWCSEASCHSCG